MDEITKRLDRIIELLEVIADQEEEYTAYPITGSVSWAGVNLDDWQECRGCGRLIPPGGYCDCKVTANEARER